MNPLSDFLRNFQSLMGNNQTQCFPADSPKEALKQLKLYLEPNKL